MPPAAAAAGTAPPPGRPVPPPPPPAVWGAVPGSPPDAGLANPFGSDATSSGARPAVAKPAPKPSKAAPAPRPFGASAGSGDSPEQDATRGWRKARRGLGWVLFGLFFLALPGFAEFGKHLYVRTQGALPSGAGEGWIKIEGYINSGGKAVALSKEDIINIGCYGIPILLGGLFLFLGRLRAGAAPRSSGAKGLFAFSGLFTLVGLVGLCAYVVCTKMPEKQGEFPAQLVADYGKIAFLICGLTAEFWFLTGLTATGLALKQPKVARTVGLFGFVVALAVAIRYVGWDLYLKEIQPNLNVPDLPFYESMALMIGWLIVVGVLWRAVSSTRGAIRDHLGTVGD